MNALILIYSICIFKAEYSKTFSVKTQMKEKILFVKAGSVRAKGEKLH